MRKTNRITAMLLSTMIAGSTLAVPAFASSTDESVAIAAAANAEFVDINGYNCRLVDGEYVTVIDGEEYIVIDLGSGISDGISTYSFRDPWDGVPQVDVSDGSEYTASVDLTLGDYKSPIYYTGTSNPDLSAYIGTGYWVPQLYHFQIHTYEPATGWTLQVDRNLWLGNGHKYLLTGTPALIIEKIAFEIKADSLGIKKFNYWFGKA